MHEPHRAIGRAGREIEQSLMVARAEQLSDDLEADRREQQHDLPVDLQRPEHLPDAAVQAGEHERRELPEHVLGAQLAEAAAGKAAADGERQARRTRRRRAAGCRPCAPTMTPGVRAVDQAGEKCAFERQVGGVVVEEQARRRRRADSRTPRLSAKVRRSGDGRCSKIRKWRNRRNRTRIVAAAAMTASFTSSVVSRSWSVDRG